ncbi:MAG: glycosyltransferase family 4 protein, partial [Ignavibacteriaceae bacterium]|nr:glycosyltransferase family 4 protein [Ignavibacteriaceae bacterium]
METQKESINIVVICKLFDQNVYDTIFPLTNSVRVNQIFVLRDSSAKPMNRVSYISSTLKPGFMRHLHRFYLSMSFKSESPVLYYGVYDFPHAIIAVATAFFRRKKSVFGFISNPNYNRAGLKGLLLDFAYKKCSILTTPGSFSKSVFIKKGILEENIFIIPNAIDTEYYQSTKEEKIYDLLFFARLSFEKHPELFIDLVKTLKKEYPGIKAAIAGTGPLSTSVSKTVEDSGLLENIVILGYIPDRELKNLYSKSKVYLMFSETEGQPRTAVEAMACGVPVILSKAGDCEDIVTEGIDGHIVSDYNDVYRYVNHVKTILFSGEYNKYSLAARKKAESKYSYSALTKLSLIHI